MKIPLSIAALAFTASTAHGLGLRGPNDAATLNPTDSMYHGSAPMDKYPPMEQGFDYSGGTEGSYDHYQPPMDHYQPPVDHYSGGTSGDHYSGGTTGSYDHYQPPADPPMDHYQAPPSTAGSYDHYQPPMDHYQAPPSTAGSYDPSQPPMDHYQPPPMNEGYESTYEDHVADPYNPIEEDNNGIPVVCVNDAIQICNYYPEVELSHYEKEGLKHCGLENLNIIQDQDCVALLELALLHEEHHPQDPYNPVEEDHNGVPEVCVQDAREFCGYDQPAMLTKADEDNLKGCAVQNFDNIRNPDCKQMVEMLILHGHDDNGDDVADPYNPIEEDNNGIPVVCVNDAIQICNYYPEVELSHYDKEGLKHCAISNVHKFQNPDCVALVELARQHEEHPQDPYNPIEEDHNGVPEVCVQDASEFCGYDQPAKYTEDDMDNLKGCAAQNFDNIRNPGCKQLVAMLLSQGNNDNDQYNEEHAIDEVSRQLGDIKNFEDEVKLQSTNHVGDMRKRTKVSKRLRSLKGSGDKSDDEVVITRRNKSKYEGKGKTKNKGGKRKRKTKGKRKRKTKGKRKRKNNEDTTTSASEVNSTSPAASGVVPPAPAASASGVDSTTPASNEKLEKIQQILNLKKGRRGLKSRRGKR